MKGSRWKGGIPRSIRKVIQTKQYNARRREKYAASKAPVKTKEQKREELRVLNEKQHRIFGDKAEKIKHIYSAKSRVLRSSDKNIAVKTESGKIGWIDKRTGSFLGAEELPTQLLRGLDASWNPIGEFGGQLEEMYNQLSPIGKSKFSDVVRDMDWEMYWNDVYNGGDIDTQEQFYEGMQTELKSLLENYKSR